MFISQVANAFSFQGRLLNVSDAALKTHRVGHLRSRGQYVLRTAHQPIGEAVTSSTWAQQVRHR